MKRDNTYKKVGLVGLAIQLAMNLVALFVLKKGSAEFFSDQWWSGWFPTYIVWLSLIIVGFASCRDKDGTDPK